MSDLKVLLISHNHPAVRAGGAESYALELYDGMRVTPGFEPVLLARAGPPVSKTNRYHEGTLFTMVNEDPNQYLMYTDVSDYDWLFGRSPSKATITRYLRDFLLALRPDVVHFQHTLFIGYDAIRVTRNTLPNVPILYTLHEYLPICHRNGQMIRAQGDELCSKASSRRCHECFPEISPQTFAMRRQFIESHFSLVDLFVAPSRTLRQRYVDWGIPQDRIIHEPYGRLRMERRATESEDRPRNRFGFFGQLLHFKGVTVLLEAMKLLGPEFPGHLWIHGANLELQPQEFRDRLTLLLSATEGTVTFAGEYEPGAVGDRMATVDWVVVPAIWWENSPLVIEEAFMNRRPVICSDVGGMAEKVSDGVDGLHFRRRDAAHLAEVIQRAATTPGLWDELRSKAPSVHDMDSHLEVLGRTYKHLVASRRPERHR